MPAPAPHLRHARAAVSGLFFLNAVLYANLVPRLPEVKDRLDLGNAALGSAVAAMPLGALVAGLFAPVLIQRFGSAKVAVTGLVALAVAVAGVPWAGAWITLAAVLFGAGAIDAVVDVAQNAHGFRVQRGYGRSIVNAFHGLWSVGAVTGGLVGSAAVALDVPLEVHLVASAAVFGVAAVVAHRFLLRGPEDAERHRSGGHVPSTGRVVGRLAGVTRRTVLLLAAFGALAAFGVFVEDAGFTWGALYLRGQVGATAAVGGLAFVSLQLAMTVGRLTGDRVVDRFGQRRVARVGGAVIAVGMLLAVAVPTVGTTLVGFALAGLGVATLIPAVVHAADELPGLPPGVGLAVVSWLLRVGFLVSPLTIGLLADATSLRAALSTVVATGLGVVVLGRVLAGGTTPRSAREAEGEDGPPSAEPSPTGTC
ncbi:MFS transporter [Egicoccus halophilus]|uniref:MFS transporter n=1 Tax=Egicoccus halophilus TaxID=1670830 RepID=A0A8J3A4Q1_9ACTN|nr:MFS transporter [Egicoccus halophilus]